MACISKEYAEASLFEKHSRVNENRVIKKKTPVMHSNCFFFVRLLYREITKTTNIQIYKMKVTQKTI